MDKEVGPSRMRHVRGTEQRKGTAPLLAAQLHSILLIVLLPLSVGPKRMQFGPHFPDFSAACRWLFRKVCVLR